MLHEDISKRLLRSQMGEEEEDERLYWEYRWSVNLRPDGY
jgi:hypothetical protein